MKTTLGLIVVCGSFFASVEVAGASGPEESIAVDVEVREKTQKDVPDSSIAVTLTVTGERGCAQVEVERDDSKYEIRVCRQGGEVSSPVLAFHIARAARGPDGEHKKKLMMTSRIATGKRVVIGKIQHGDGTATQIAAEARATSPG